MPFWKQHLIGDRQPLFHEDIDIQYVAGVVGSSQLALVGFLCLQLIYVISW